MFYKLDASRVTLREFWWETKLFFWVGLLVKLFRIRLRGSSDDLAVDSLRPFLCDESKVPPVVLARFAPTLRQLNELGFERPIWHDAEDVFQATGNTLATLRHESGRVWARVQCRTNFGRVPARVKFFTTLISRTPGGFIATGNGKYDMAWPKTHDTIRFRDMAVGELWARHQQRMTAAVQPVAREQLLDLAEEYHGTLRDFHLARGVFQPLGDEELALCPALPPPPITGIGVAHPAMAPGATPPSMPLTAPPVPPDLMEVATLDELRRLQNKKANWRSSVVLLVLSAFVFILMTRTSDSGQSWEYVGIIVGILLFHEMGHYLAMKLFGYRNLRMFFIPGFGAAVSGRHYNAPAWKKIVVSLMGPLPGIFAGVVLLVLSLLLHNELLWRIGVFAIIINALNLVPVLPFDGGWVAHAALFSRHPKLDVGFRLAAALVLILIGITVPGTRFLPYLAIFSLLALPMAYKLAVIVSELRQIPGMGVSPDGQTIPPETARIILAKVRQRFTRNLNARLAAQHVASVFESLNTRPASVGATIGLLSLHAAGIGLALLVGVAVLVARSHDRVHRPLVAPARDAVTLDGLESSGPPPIGKRRVLVARFKSEQAARAAFGDLSSTRPGSRFGQTLLVSLSPPETADQQDLLSHFKTSAEDAFVESDEMRASIELSFKLPQNDQGRQAIEDLEVYFQGRDWRLIPPWAPETDWPAAQRALQTRLRRLVKELRTVPAADEKQKQLRQQIAAAQRDGDTAAADQLRIQVKQADADAELAHQIRLEKEYGHPDLIQKWAQIKGLKERTERATRLKQEIAPQLGQWPVDKPDALLAADGFVSDAPSTGVRVYCWFVHADTALLSMTRWLFTQGAVEVRYRIHGSPVVDDANSSDSPSP